MIYKKKLVKLFNEVVIFNAGIALKRGLGVMPFTYGIGFASPLEKGGLRYRLTGQAF
jgi:hypothetical protein